MPTILYFSPTGNVKYIAEKLASHPGLTASELLPLEFTVPENLESNEQLILLYPIHAFNPPRTVRRFVKKIPTGLYKNIVIVSVGCAESWVNRAAASGLKQIFTAKGYPVPVNEIVAMPLTIITAFSKELTRKLITSADEKINTIAKYIIDGRESGEQIPVKSKIMHFLGKVEGPAARLFGLELHAGKDCTSCGICVRNCPEKNIRFNRKNMPKFGTACLMCMRCIYNCPERTISPRISKFIPIKNGYRSAEHR